MAGELCESLLMFNDECILGRMVGNCTTQGRRAMPETRDKSIDYVVWTP